MCKTNKTCPEIKIQWVPDQLSNYKKNSQNEPHKCFKLPQMRLTGSIYCLNFTSDSNKEVYYVYIGIVNNENQNKISWNDATSMCKQMGGFLPSIRSKSELDEFIALVTFSQYIPPQGEIFIGLSTKIK